MNIQNLQAAAYGNNIYDVSVKSNAKKPAVPTVATQQKEQVELSEASRNLAKLKEVVDSSPEVRIQLVEDLKEKIKKNGYPIETAIYKAVEKMVGNNII